MKNTPFSCFHPVSFVNPHTGESMSAPCGHCPACLKRKQSKYVSLLNMEYQTYKHAIFFTLTLDESKCDLLVDSDTGEYSTFASKYDIQCFVKRIRRFLQSYRQKIDETILKHVHSNLPIKSLLDNYEKSKMLSYFICAEYGKNGFKHAHYHGLLFTDCDELGKNAYQVLSSCWPFGFINCSPAGRKSLGYVAKYITATSSKPDHLQETNFGETFALKSKQIGLRLFTEESAALKQNVISCLTEYAISNGKGITSSLPPSSFISKFYPKCRQFFKLSHQDKLTKYLEFYREKRPSLADFITISDQPDDPFYMDECKKDYNRALKDYYISQTFIKNANFFNLSFDKYLSIIEEFYSRVDYFNLKNFLSSIESFTRNNSIIFLNYLYHDQYYALTHHSSSPSLFFGDISPSKIRMNYDLQFNPDFIAYKNEVLNDLSKDKKTRELNDLFFNQEFILNYGQK